MTLPVFLVRGMQYSPPFGILGTLPSMTVGTAYSAPLTVVGGTPAYSLGAVTLPAGIGDSIAGATITVSGIPTGAGLGPGYAKTFDVTINVTDSIADAAIFTQTVNISVPMLVWTPTYPAGAETIAYDYTPPTGATGGTGGYTYGYTGTLPPGLTFVAASGRLHGVPTDDSGSPYAFTVTATDSEGNVSTGAALTIEIAASDPDFASVSALLHFDGADGSTTFTDVIGNTWTTAANSQLDTAFFKWGTASMLHGVTNYHIRTASNARFGFGSGDYTLEGWYRYPSSTGDRCILDTRTGANTGIAVYVSTAGAGNAGKLAVLSNVALLARATTAFTANTWQHWAVVRDGTTLYGYLDGVVQFTVADARVYAAASTCFFGDNYLAPSQPTEGNSDDFRVTKGVCRYPGGTTFSPPPAAFPDF